MRVGIGLWTCLSGGSGALPSPALRSGRPQPDGERSSEAPPTAFPSSQHQRPAGGSCLYGWQSGSAPFLEAFTWAPGGPLHRSWPDLPLLRSLPLEPTHMLGSPTLFLPEATTAPLALQESEAGKDRQLKSGPSPPVCPLARTLSRGSGSEVRDIQGGAEGQGRGTLGRRFRQADAEAARQL